MRGVQRMTVVTLDVLAIAVPVVQPQLQALKLFWVLTLNGIPVLPLQLQSLELFWVLTFKTAPSKTIPSTCSSCNCYQAPLTSLSLTKTTCCLVASTTSPFQVWLIRTSGTSSWLLFHLHLKRKSSRTRLSKNAVSNYRHQVVIVVVVVIYHCKLKISFIAFIYLKKKSIYNDLGMSSIRTNNSLKLCVIHCFF